MDLLSRPKLPYHFDLYQTAQPEVFLDDDVCRLLATTQNMVTSY